MKVIETSVQRMVLNKMNYDTYKDYNNCMFDLAGVAPDHQMTNIVSDSIFARLKGEIGLEPYHVRVLRGRVI